MQLVSIDILDFSCIQFIDYV